MDDVQLLFPGELNEIDSVSGDTDGQLGIFFWVVHGVNKSLPVKNIDIDVMSFVVEISIQQTTQILDPLLFCLSESARGPMENV